MSDLNWCTFCDNAISTYSDSLYCSEDCLRSDALSHHPLLGYDYAELKDFPRSSPLSSSASSTHSTISPPLSPIPFYKDIPTFQLNTSIGKTPPQRKTSPIYLLPSSWSQK